MPNPKLILIKTLFILLVIGCKQNNQDSSRNNITAQKEEIKDSISKMLRTYEYSDLAILFDGKIALNMNTMEFDAQEIWEFADEQPKEFIEWYELKIKPQKHQLTKRNTNTTKALQVQSDNSFEQNVPKSDEETIADLEREIEALFNKNIKTFNNQTATADIDVYDQSIYLINAIFPLNEIDIFYKYDDRNPQYGVDFMFIKCKSGSDCIRTADSFVLSYQIPFRNESTVIEIKNKINKLRYLLSS